MPPKLSQGIKVPHGDAVDTAPQQMTAPSQQGDSALGWQEQGTGHVDSRPPPPACIEVKLVIYPYTVCRLLSLDDGTGTPSFLHVNVARGRAEALHVIFTY